MTIGPKQKEQGMEDFAGKVVIVTGAASGISRVILTRFVQGGARAALVDRDVAWGRDVEKELQDQGHEVLFVETDVRDAGQVDRVVAETVARFGRVDILVHGAGVGVHSELVDMTDDEWDLQIDVQLRGAFLLSRALARQLIAQGQGGRLILLGSTAGNNARVRSGAHAVSKAGEIQLVHVLALELGRHGITANVVSPGLTDISGLSRTVQHPEYQRAFLSQVPLGRLARPDEIANAVLFLASEQAAFISGQVLCVDGGYSAGKLAVQGPLGQPT
jgi:3-oxoacyl-[acyl-carrier protein] reductase